jgi:hypothetical protein
MEFDMAVKQMAAVSKPCGCVLAVVDADIKDLYYANCSWRYLSPLEAIAAYFKPRCKVCRKPKRAI